MTNEAGPADRPRLSAMAGRLRAGGLERVTWRVMFGVMVVMSTFWIGGYYLTSSLGNLFIDAHIYYRATEAWMAGGNPWLTSYHGLPFAGIPPTLLLNVPLMPLGETGATAFWVVSNTASIVFLIRRLRLPWWTVLLLPVVEGWLGAGPDISLAALAAGPLSWIATVTKPYSAPAILAKGRWRSIVIAGAIVLVTVPILPWWTFWESRDAIAQAFAVHAGTPQSAAGNVVLMPLVGIALLSLGWRRGMSLATPGLLAQQPHYMVFSLDTITRSRILTIAAITPAQYSMAAGVIVYALIHRFRVRFSRPR